MITAALGVNLATAPAKLKLHQRQLDPQVRLSDLLLLQLDRLPRQLDRPQRLLDLPLRQLDLPLRQLNRRLC